LHQLHNTTHSRTLGGLSCSCQQAIVNDARIEFAILQSNMNLISLPATVTYPFQLAGPD